MKRQPHHLTYYDKLLFLFKNAAAFLPLAMIPFGLLARSTLVDGRYYSGDGVFATIVGAYAIASALNFWYARRYPPKLSIDLVFAVVFHLLTLLFILFVSGFLSAFLSVWIVLMISTDLRFGTKGFFSSFSGLCLAGLLMFLTHPDVPQGEKFEIVQGAVVVGAIGFVIAKIRGITDHERSSLAKSRQEELYQREQLLALVNSMGDAVVATNEQGTIKVYNSTLLSLLDSNLSLTGKSIDDVLKFRDSHGKTVQIIPEAQLRHTVFSRTDLSRQVAEGDTMRLYVNVAPIQPGYHSHAERGFIFILRDITKEKTLEEQRDEFVSVVSHELRTPVAIAEGSLSNIQVMLARGGDPKIISKTLNDAYEHILFLAKLVNDLATLSRVERGSIDKIELVDVTAMLQNTYDTYVKDAEAKQLKLNIKLEDNIPGILTSPLHFQEILQNLMTNALKYTKTGSVTISAATQAGQLHISIVDTGIGISQSDQPHMFQKFYRSEDYRTRETSGTGLGLYVCQQLAEKIGMKLTFTSKLNHGSTFTLSIPLDHDPNAKANFEKLT